MLTVYKYGVSMADAFSVELPDEARLLYIDVQGDKPYLWALVDPDQITKKRYFRLVGTGHRVAESPDEVDYVGTFMMCDGRLVLHLFELVS